MTPEASTSVPKTRMATASKELGAGRQIPVFVHIVPAVGAAPLWARSEEVGKYQLIRKMPPWDASSASAL